MTDKLDIAGQIAELVKLQEIDSDIFKLKAEKEQKPIEIQELKDSLAQKQSGMQQAEDDLKNLQLKHKEKEVDLGTKEGEVKKLQTQLYQLKTNKEYSTMLQEIERHNADNSLLEEEIIKLMDEIDAASGKVAEEKKKFEEESKKVDAGIKVIEARIKEIEESVAGLKKKREALTPSIGQKVLKDYERILEGRNGLALVEVINDACGGCYINLPPQVINEVRMKDKVTYCESCWRMLYIRDESKEA